MSEQLKPCPFCGSTSVVLDDEPLMVSVMCDQCECSTRLHGDAHEAITAWNARAADAALSRLRDTQRVLVEALRKVAIRCPTDNPNYTIASVGDTARAALASVEQQEQPFHLSPAGDEEVTAPLPLTCWGLSSFCAETGHKCRAAGECVYAPPAPEQQEPSEPSGVEVTARDAARYRWLRERLAIEDVEQLDRDFWGTPDEAESAKTDRAIDAAMQEPKPHVHRFEHDDDHPGYFSCDCGKVTKP